MKEHPPTTNTTHDHTKEKGSELRLVAWEVTRNCNLNCIHCRAAATKGPYAGELDTEACFRLLDQIKEVGKPV
ncbi:MAG: radical SAM/SPASM domain-containing protein, partial [Thermodesulfobacteriota bacterium]|nr:radical SAM/SPASM domain-containing protein [Thermodesulfobacteriota bacterium]